MWDPRAPRFIALPAERLLGARPRGSSRDVGAHVHACACAIGGVGGGGCQGRVPAERLLGAHPQGSSRDVWAHVHACACALGGVGIGSQGRVPAE